jgi:hypothetical protein
MTDKERNAEATYAVDISIQHNTLVVGANGGNIVGVPEDRVRWSTGTDQPPFTLEFFRVASEPTVAASKDDGCGEVDVAALPRWPFTDPPQPPPNGVIGPTWEFVGVLKGPGTPATSYKYYVTVQNLRLDPIIIVDR